MRKLLSIAAMIIAVPLMAAGCFGGPSAQEQAQNAAANSANSNGFYVPKNHLEQKNYNDRQRLADDPATIIWCTFFPPTVGQEPITVPIAGKLTSSGKKPVPDSAASDPNWTQDPGPDGMYGSSAEYRYGFDPTRTVYYDFTQLPSICTNAPLIWQKNKTTIAVGTDTTLSSLDKAASAALAKGNAKQAAQILRGAESKVGK